LRHNLTTISISDFIVPLGAANPGNMPSFGKAALLLDVLVILEITVSNIAQLFIAIM